MKKILSIILIFALCSASGGLLYADVSFGWTVYQTPYTPGSTDVALADGGTGASLADPAADTLLGWDDTDNAVSFFTLGTGLTYTHATHTLSAATIDWTAPGTIGSVTPNTGLFTTLGVGTGAIAPATRLQVVDTVTSSPRGIMSSQYNDGVDGARFHMRKGRGTLASPTVVVTGDNLGRLVASGYDGSAYQEMASIIFGTEGTIASGRIPTNLSFWTATDAATSVLTEAMRIDSKQRIGIGGINSPLAGFHNGFASIVSVPAKLMSGAWFTGGTTTTTKPHLLIEPTGTTSTGWSTSGTGLGVNAASGFAGNVVDFQLNGTSYFKLTSGGRTSITELYASGTSYLQNIYSANPASPLVLIGGSATANIAIVNISGTFTSTSGVSSGLKIIPTYNQTSGSAANTDILLNRTETAIGSGTQRLISAQVGSVERWGVDNYGIHSLIIGRPFLVGGSGIGNYTSVTFPTANKDYVNKTGLGTALGFGGTSLVGSLLTVTDGTGATVGSYRVITLIDANTVQVDRNIHASGTDITNGTIGVARDVVGIFATDGTNGQRIMNYSAQNKPLQFGGDVMATALTGLVAKDIQVGNYLAVPTLLTTGDLGGLANTIGMTNAVSAYVDGSGSQAPKGITGAGNPTFAGYMKFYNGTTAVYVPYYSAIQ